jgi:aminoglycoside phosphotransferase (APT) family kinase protein
MSAPAATRGARAWAVRNDLELRAELERALSEHFGSERTISQLKVRPNPYRSSFAIHDVSVVVDGDTRLELLVKNLSRQALRRTVISGRPQFLYDPRREINVYRDILAPTSLGTPGFYGALIDGRRDRFWLFMERVCGPQLAETGDFGIWLDVARWLAGMHDCLFSRLAAIPTASRARLVNYDERFYGRWAQRTRKFLKRKTVGRNVTRRLEHVISHYETVVDELVALPRGIVHGEFYSFNVIVQEQATGLRVCPVDWEVAGEAPFLVDLAGLIAGSWTIEEKRSLALSYYGASQPVATYSPDQFYRALDLCRLHVALQWTGWSEKATHRLRWSEWAAEALDAAEALGV